MNKRYSLSTKIRQTVGFDQFEYCPDEAKKLVIDWYILDELLNGAKEELPFYDYSFALAPLYKAVESILDKISNDLGLSIEGSQLGAFFNEDNIEKVFPEIKKKIKDKRKEIEIKSELSELKSFLMRYRHIPAHSRSRFENIDQQRMAAQSALHNIRCLLTDLLKYSVISLPNKKQMEEDLESIIPF